MDEWDFDAVLRTVAASGTRRRLLGVVAGMLGATVAGSPSSTPVMAKSRQRQKATAQRGSNRQDSGTRQGKDTPPGHGTKPGPARKPNGATCTKGCQCQSERCCGVSRGKPGTCCPVTSPPPPPTLLPFGAACTSNAACASGICACIEADCAAGGLCAEPADGACPAGSADVTTPGGGLAAVCVFGCSPGNCTSCGACTGLQVCDTGGICDTLVNS